MNKLNSLFTECAMHRKLIAVIVMFSILGSVGFSQNISVSPGESIQAAIDDVTTVDGDVIIVDPGTYTENINFMGKAITIESTDPGDPDVVAATIIDGGQAGSVVTFATGEGNDSIIRGLTIRRIARLGIPIRCMAAERIRSGRIRK